MQGGFDIKDVLAILRRRWLLLALPVVIGAPLTVAVATLLPSVYQADARILVESQLIPDELVRSTVEQSAAERIQLIRQRLMTRNNLLEIAERHGVYAGEQGVSQSEIVRRMQAGIRIDGTSSGSGRRRNTRVTGVQITFRYVDGVIAARVVNEMVTRVLNQNVQQRTDRASGTLAFFNEQTERLSQELQRQSTRISAYKLENRTALPTAAVGLQTELAQLRDKRFDLSAQLAEAQDLAAGIRRAVERGETPLLATRAATPEQAELARLRNTLVAQSAVLADSHPTIRLLNARIAALQDAVNASAPVDAASDAASDAAQGDAASDAAQGDAAVALGAAATAELTSLQRRISLVQEQIDAVDARVAEIEDALQAAPRVEMELGALERGYQTLQTQYREAVLKRAQAEVGERLETSQQAERFEVVEQAVASDRPISPNRQKIMLAGVGASGMLGFGLMALAELLNRAIRTPNGMARQLDALPIVTVPYVESARERTWRRWRLRALLCAALVTPPLALYVVDTYYLPLPLLFEQLMERSGLERFVQPVIDRLGR